MKNIIKITAALSAVIMLTGCGQRIEETPAEPVQTTAEAVTEATDVTEESGTDTAKVTEKAPEPVKTLTSTEEFFTIFNGADISTARIADNIDDAIKAVNEDISVSELSLENVKKAVEDNALSSSLFSFSMNGASGILPSESADGDIFACGYTLDDTEYTVVFGSDKVTTFSETSKYVNTCGEADYLAFCAERDGQIMLMPVAAGNSDCGIYGVIPVAEYMGYDMTGVASFKGIPDSFHIRITDIEDDDSGNTSIYYTIDSSFEDEIYFRCGNIFLNGEDITANIDEETSDIMKGSGYIDFNGLKINDNDALYFTGKVYSTEDNSEICSAAVACVADDDDYDNEIDDDNDPDDINDDDESYDD